MRNLAILLGVIALLAGCGKVRKPIWTTPSEPALQSPREEALSEKAHRLEGELSAVRKDLNEERDRLIRTLATISAGLCFVAGIGCTVAAIFLPLMKKRLTVGAVAFFAGMCVSLTLRQWVPVMPWIGLGLLAIGIGATLPTFIRHARRLGG